MRTLSWRARGALLALLVLAIATIAVTNRMLSARFTEKTRNRAELRLALYSGNLVSELRQNAIVSQLLSRDPVLIAALGSGDFSQSSQRLITVNKEISAAALTLLDKDGRVVASTRRETIGKAFAQSSAFVEAMRTKTNVFNVVGDETGKFRFFFSRQIDSPRGGAGVILVEVGLDRFERAWAGILDAVLVTDSEGQIVLATESRWRGLSEEEALARESPRGAIGRALQATAAWGGLPPDAYVRGQAVMRVDKRVGFRGWRIASFTTYGNVREQVNGFLAIEIMGFAILLALAFYLLNRKAALRLAVFQRESAELRKLNARLQREIAERQRVQKDLAVAEQTLAQSSKLAALGEMSAAVSHELNQPLAAMRTYLAGARLLLGRNRPEEALSAFQRIDDLIERMGAITRQLKSHARQGEGDLHPVNLGQALNAALAMMEPQLRQQQVAINLALPEEPVMVMGDLVRVEQVMINLLRNALDATRNVPDASIDILLTAGETAVLTVRDNGPGIENIDSLFEPFFTTKQPGEGVGLGLAISSGIVSGMSGRLTARNAPDGGAVFEMQLPILPQTQNDRPAAE